MAVASRRLGRAGGATDRAAAWECGHSVGRGACRMENCALIGLSRQISLHRELEVVANNIANIEHHRLQGRRLGVPRIPDAGRPPWRLPGHRPAAELRARPRDLARFQQRRDPQTGNPLDVAIDGDAFLVVQTPRGERYTRNGALQINATGELVTARRRPRARRRRPDPVPAHRQQHLDQSGRHHHRARGRQRRHRLGARQAAAGALRADGRPC